MKYPIGTMVLVLGLLVLLGACTNPTASPTVPQSSTLPQTPTDLTPGPAINEAKAIALAAKVVPIGVIARAQVSAEFAPSSGPNGSWLVVFDSVNVTRDELGWPENPGWEFGLSRPEGDYETVVIGVDAGTGDIYLKLAGSYRQHMMSP